MASFSPYYKSFKRYFIVALLAFFFTSHSTFVRAEGIDVKSAQLIEVDDGYMLRADFDINLGHLIEEALSHGVSIYFVIEFQLVRPRWYWFDEKIVHERQEYKLSYNALTQQYRLNYGSLFQNFPNLQDAVNVLSRIRNRQLIEPGMLNRGNTYYGAVRMFLDVSQLPKPFQIYAISSKEWNLSSDWYRWAISS